MTKMQIRRFFEIETGKAISAKGICEYLKLDKMSERLREIEYHCWELSEAGILKAIDCREQTHGGLFFEAR